MATRLLTDPTLEAVNAALAELCAAANHRQRTRTATLAIDPPEWAEPTGLWRAGGDGVCNAYKNTAFTTVAGCCWVTLPDGRRLVLVEATRTAAPSSAHASREALPFGFHTAITRWENADESQLIAVSIHGAACQELAAALGTFGTQDEAFEKLPVVADWLDERGLPTAHVRAYLALRAAAAV